MEIYSLYQAATLTALYFTESNKTAFIAGAIGGVGIWLALFILQGFGLYKMAKNLGLKNRILAFVPFVNLWFVGKLTGECNFFGQKVKRAGMYVMITQIIGTMLTLLMISSEMYLWLKHGKPQLSENNMAYWIGLVGFDKRIADFYRLSEFILPIFQLIYEIFLVVLFLGLYKRYTPQNHLALGMLTLFVPLSRYIIVFVLRKRKAINYEAYMRARREAYARQYQQYHTPYGNPYQNPYGQQQSRPAQPPKPEEPFEEFTSSKGEEDGDDFFS